MNFQAIAGKLQRNGAKLLPVAENARSAESKVILV
jgi:hypothetical protein